MLSTILATCSFLPVFCSLYGTTVIAVIPRREGRGFLRESQQAAWRLFQHRKLHAAVQLTALLLVVVAGQRLRLAITRRFDTACINALFGQVVFNSLGALARQEQVVS